MWVCAGLNFHVFDLKFSQILGLIEGYNLSKFWITSLQIKVRTSFFVWQKFFSIFVEIHNIEIRNRLLWVIWYHRNSTYPPYWNAEGPSYAQYELIKPRERPAIWRISTRYFSVLSNHLEGLLRISILQIPTKMRKNFCQTKKLVLTLICKLVIQNFDRL